VTPGSLRPDGGGGRDDDVLAGRFVLHLEEIQAQVASFDRVRDRLGDDGFIDAWRREGTPAQADDKGSLERAYEQIINDLLGAFDELERAAANAEKVPDPRLLDGDAAQWWSAAGALGFDIASADTNDRPGRWRRFAIFGFMPHAEVPTMINSCDTRHLFQHAYAARTPCRRCGRRSRQRSTASWPSATGP
jgi:hypothetical protein